MAEKRITMNKHWWVSYWRPNKQSTHPQAFVDKKKELTGFDGV